MPSVLQMHLVAYSPNNYLGKYNCSDATNDQFRGESH